MFENAKKILLVVVLVVILVLLLVSGCANEVRLSGPNLSWRSGIGDGPAGNLTRQSGGHSSRMGSSRSAARVSPAND